MISYKKLQSDDVTLRLPYLPLSMLSLYRYRYALKVRYRMCPLQQLPCGFSSISTGKRGVVRGNIKVMVNRFTALSDGAVNKVIEALFEMKAERGRESELA